LVKKSQLENISKKEARKKFVKGTSVGQIGSPSDLASLTVWLLSPIYITGQTISVDGGSIKSTMG